MSSAATAPPGASPRPVTSTGCSAGWWARSRPAALRCSAVMCAAAPTAAMPRSPTTRAVTATAPNAKVMRGRPGRHGWRGLCRWCVLSWRAPCWDGTAHRSAQPGVSFVAGQAATIALHLPRRRGRTGLTASRSRDDPWISQGLRSPTRLGPASTLWPGSRHAGTGYDPRSRRRSRELLRLPRGVEPGTAMDTWVFPVPLGPRAMTFSRRITNSHRASSRTSILLRLGMAVKSNVSKLLTAGNLAALIRRSIVRRLRPISSSSTSRARNRT